MKLGWEQNDEEGRWQDKGRHGCISFPKFDLISTSVQHVPSTPTNSKLPLSVLCFLLTRWPPLVFWDFECKTNHIVTLPVLWPKAHSLYSKPSLRLCHLHTTRDASSFSRLDSYVQQEQKLSSLSPYQGIKYRIFKASAILIHAKCWS